MKLIGLINTSSMKISISQVRDASGRPFMVPPGKIGYVTPTVAEHPAVLRFIGAGLEEGDKIPEPKLAVVASKPEEVPEEQPTEVEEEETKPDIRDLFLSAPGITESNIELILDSYSSVEDLCDADKDALLDCGISKSFVSRLQDWAIENV